MYRCSIMMMDDDLFPPGFRVTGILTRLLSTIPCTHICAPRKTHNLTIALRIPLANVASSDSSSSGSSVHIVVARIRQNTPGRSARLPQPRRAHPSSLRWSSAKMAAMRASAWATERGSARPRGGRVSSASARKRVRRARKSSSRGRGAGAEPAALLRDLY
jgi:hypothetical protein